MRARDLVRLTWRTLRAQPLRSGLTVLGIVIGIAAVTLLTAIGHGVRSHIVEQFTQFGTDIVVVQPGKEQTWGVPGFLGGTERPLTFGDARALARIPEVGVVEPLVYGMARVEYGGRGRYVYIYGGTHRHDDVWRFDVRLGRFLPEVDYEEAPAVCVLGSTLRRELFGNEPAIGARVRVGGVSVRVIGVSGHKGTFLGMDIDDAAYVPVALAMRIFNREELNEIDLRPRRPSDLDAMVAKVREVLRDRHDGREDFTVVRQDAMLATFDKVLRVITAAVAGIAAISLLVGAVGILTIQWVAVHERTPEVGIAMATGATRGQVLGLFLAESAGLGMAGGVAGASAGLGLAALLGWAVPGLPVALRPEALLSALVVSLTVGLLSGAAPAWRAARLDPVAALRTE
jgi:putative ABC transport system permease protein